MSDNKITTLDQYFSKYPKPVRERLETIRALIREVAPEATEGYSYRMAAIRLYDYVLIYFAGYDTYIGMYPAPVTDPDFPGDLSGYASGKGTVQFPHDQPLPLGLIRQIVSYRAAQNAAKAAAKKSKKV
jgi:uncharacterized protein YdhG (YjbR/CyaY superfamily)